MHRHFSHHGHRRHQGDYGPEDQMGHDRGSRRFGHFGSGFMGGAAGWGGRAFRAGRRLASGDLQLVLLALLSDRPSHGYELIKALEERSGGFYVPSPGMIYPALTWLEEMGYASVSVEGAKKLYSITESGREYLKENREAADAMLGQLEYIGKKMGRVREIFGFEETDEDGGSREVHAARHDLRQALRDKRGAPAEEKSRIAAVLRAAAEQIRGKT